MLVGAIATAILVAQDTGELSFSIADLRANLLSAGSQEWIFCFFAAAFLVKMPAFPIHGWMPDAYRAAPLPVVLLLSGVLSKVGAYGFLRVVLPVYPEATVTFQEVVMVIAVASILYGSVMAFTRRTSGSSRLLVGRPARLHHPRRLQPARRRRRRRGAADGQPRARGRGDLRRHRDSLRPHADRGPDRDGRPGDARPVLAALFLVVTLATLAMPGSANFIGEFYILNGAFQSKIALAFVAAIGVALAAFYALRLYQRTMHNRLPEGVESREISLRDSSCSRRWSPASSRWRSGPG